MLYVCPTPIGNLQDITLRVLTILGECDLVACEDTRHTGNLLRHFGLRKELISFFEHNELARLDLLLGHLRAGRKVALVSDAGTPALSDPGYVLVRACLEEGLPLTVLPGPSAVVVALVASGLPTDRFTFVGFLPRGAAGRVIGFLEEAGRAGGTLVAFESPKRLPATLRAIAARWPDRLLAVCRELTKLHEEIVRGPAAELAERLDRPLRGEIVLVLQGEDMGPASEEARAAGAAQEERVRFGLAGLLDRGWGAREAAAYLAQVTGRPVRPLYSLALALQRERGRA